MGASPLKMPAPPLGFVLDQRLEQSSGLKSGQDIIRGSSNVPLSAQGEEQAAHLALRFVKKGGLNVIYSSDLVRASDTAEGISKTTDAPIVITQAFHPWHLGDLEGQPTPDVLARMQRFISRTPNEAPSGHGGQSTEEGESFNAFKRRFLTGLKNVIDLWKRDPTSRVGIITHYRGVKLVEAWVRRGLRPDLTVDVQHMMRDGDPPGSVQRLYVRPGGKWQLERINMERPAPLKPGVYLIRHSLTAWNKEDGGEGSEVEEPAVRSKGI